mmetsp:Transcript_84525/g.167812  ORF Transcript_84525/g.167812 Transcript_84525/m.167812 type:complete len:126 (+) Transcript_84525:101-478(+)
MASSIVFLLALAAVPLPLASALDMRPDEATFAAALAAEEAEGGDFEALNLLQGAGPLRQVQKQRRAEEEADASTVLEQGLESLADEAAAENALIAGGISLMQQGATLKTASGDPRPLEHGEGLEL